MDITKKDFCVVERLASLSAQQFKNDDLFKVQLYSIKYVLIIEEPFIISNICLKL